MLVGWLFEGGPQHGIQGKQHTDRSEKGRKRVALERSGSDEGWTEVSEDGRFIFETLQPRKTGWDVDEWDGHKHDRGCLWYDINNRLWDTIYLCCWWCCCCCWWYSCCCVCCCCCCYGCCCYGWRCWNAADLAAFVWFTSSNFWAFISTTPIGRVRWCWLASREPTGTLLVETFQQTEAQQQQQPMPADFILRRSQNRVDIINFVKQSHTWKFIRSRTSCFEISSESLCRVYKQQLVGVQRCWCLFLNNTGQWNRELDRSGIRRIWNSTGLELDVLSRQYLSKKVIASFARFLFVCVFWNINKYCLSIEYIFDLKTWADVAWTRHLAAGGTRSNPTLLQRDRNWREFGTTTIQNITTRWRRRMTSYTTSSTETCLGIRSCRRLHRRLQRLLQRLDSPSGTCWISTITAGPASNSSSNIPPTAAAFQVNSSKCLHLFRSHKTAVAAGDCTTSSRSSRRASLAGVASTVPPCTGRIERAKHEIQRNGGRRKTVLGRAPAGTGSTDPIRLRRRRNFTSKVSRRR